MKNIAVEGMHPKMQEAYNLNRQRHLSHRGIAGHMSISEEIVKKHIQRTLSLLREALSLHTLILILVVFFGS